MSATNTTTNYNLPIFIETDKPSWLVDFNGAMRSIDSQMKTNADAIATKSPILTFNDTADIDFMKSGDIVTANLASGVSDKVGRALVKPISAPVTEQIVTVNTSGDQDALSIGSGLFNDSGVLKAVDLNFSVIENATFNGLPSGVTMDGGSLKLACNSDRTIGKIYGAPRFKNTGSTAQNLYLDTGLIVSAPAEEYRIFPVGLVFPLTPTTYGGIYFDVKTDGHVYMYCNAFANTTSYCYAFPCIYIFRDFGDTGE